MRPLIVAALCLSAAACGGEEVPPPVDETPPTSKALLSVPSGATFEVTGAFVATTRDVTIRLVSDEVGSLVYYTLDDRDPIVGEQGTGVGLTPVILTLDRDVVVRWFAIDQAGNRETAEHRLTITFDREGPELDVAPSPGIFGHAIEVTVSAGVDATLYWTENDNRLPAPGQSYTRSAPLPVIFELSSTTTLNLMAQDEAGNRDERTVRYVIDTVAPVSYADPPGGHYLVPFDVALAVDDPDATIVYTTDGTEPHEDSAVYSGSLAIDGDTELRFRARDAGGNMEAAHLERYVVGSRGRRETGLGEDADRYPAAGALELAAALIDAAGPLSGRDAPAPHYGSAWDAWAAGVTNIDAYTVQAGFAPHVMHSPGLTNIIEAGEGDADTSDNGTGADETWAARVDALAARVGGPVPASFHPVSLFYIGATSQLLVRPTGLLLDDGRPDWTEDYRTMRWSGARSADRQIHVGTTAAGLRALVSRAWVGTAGRHPSGDDAWAVRVAPVLGLRCGGCHRAGAVDPTLESASDYAALATPRGDDEARLVDLLSGAEPHPGHPAPDEQISAVRLWIDGGREASDAEPLLGSTAREGFLGLHAIEQSAMAIAHVMGAAMYDPDDGQLGPLPPDAERHYVVGRAGVTEGPGERGTPRRVDFMRVQDPEFRTGEQLRLLRSLALLVALGEARPALFGGFPLSGSPALPTAQTLAVRLATQQLRALQLTLDDEASVQTESKRPDRTASRTVTTLDLADTAIALLAADMIPGTSLRPGATRAVAFMSERLADGAGTFAERMSLDGAPDFSARRGLEVQFAALEALLGVGERQAALQLWTRLDTLWWDQEAGAWQSALGDTDYVYTPALAARVVDGLRAAVDAGFDNAEARLDTFVRRVVVERLRLAETWIEGEIGTDVDADGDGVAKPRAAGAANGLAPVFAREVRF